VINTRLSTEINVLGILRRLVLDKMQDEQPSFLIDSEKYALTGVPGMPKVRAMMYLRTRR
jgi:hypothetical protein